MEFRLYYNAIFLETRGDGIWTSLTKNDSSYYHDKVAR